MIPTTKHLNLKQVWIRLYVPLIISSDLAFTPRNKKKNATRFPFLLTSYNTSSHELQYTVTSKNSATHAHTQ